MNKMLRYVSVLFLGALLLACGGDPSIEERVENVRTDLDEVRGAPVLFRVPAQHDAIGDLKVILNEDPEHFEATLLMGEAFFEMGLWEDAEHWLSKALQLGGDPAKIIPINAQILLNTEEYTKLDGLPFDDLDPEGRSTVQAAKSVAMLNRGRPELALELIEMALQNELVSPYAEVANAKLTMELEGYEAAGEQLTDIVGRYPEYIPAWSLLGNVESAQGNARKALKAYETVIDLGGENEFTGMNALLMRIYTGKVRRASAEANDIVTTFPSLLHKDGFTFLRALSMMFQAERLHLARKFFHATQEASDEYPQSHYYLAAINLDLGLLGIEEGFEELALSNVYEFLRYFPDSMAGMKLAAKIELARGKYKNVEEVLKLLLHRKSDDIEALNVLARALIALGRTDDALNVYSKLVEQQPESIDAKARLAATYLQKGAEERETARVKALQGEVAVGTIDLAESGSGSAQGIEDTDSTESIEGVEGLEGIESTTVLVADPFPALARDEMQIGQEQGEMPAAIDTPTDAVAPGARPDVEENVPASEEQGLRLLAEILAVYPGYMPADILIVQHYLGLGLAEDAIAAAQSFRERNPSDASAYDLLARSHLAANERVEAKRAFDIALSLRPGDPEAGSGLADMALATGDYDLAREYYSEILKYEPAHINTLMRIAASYGREGNREEMVDVLQEASLENPRALEPRLSLIRYLLAVNQVSEATRLLSGFTQVEDVDPRTMEVVSASQIVTERYDQALQTLLRLLRLYPDAAQYHYMLAKAYAGVGDQKRTLEALKRVLALEPDHFFAKLAMAKLAVLSGQGEEFRQLLAELAETAPDNFDVMALQAISAQGRGDHAAAGEYRKNVYLKNPSSDSAIAYAAHLQGQGDASAAIDLLEDWIDEFEDDAAARDKLAEIYALNDRVDDAIRQYRKILKITPGNAATWNNLAWHLLEDDPEDALEYARKAIRLSSPNSAMLDTQAMALLMNDEVVAARRSLDRARSMNPDSLELLFHEAQIMVAEGDKTAAVETLQALLANEDGFRGRDKAANLLEQLM